MCIVIIMLIVAIGLTPAYSNLDYSGTAVFPLAVPVICHLSRWEQFVNRSLDPRLTVIGFMVYGYVVRLLKFSKFFDRLPRRLSFKLRTCASRLQHGEGEASPWDPYQLGCSWTKKLKILILDPFLIALCHILEIHLDILTSFLGEVRESPFSAHVVSL
jgi:hypothetical protein